MKQFEVLFYEKENGECPVKLFMAELDTDMHAKLVGLLGVLGEKGNALREPYSKYIGDGIFELRCKMGNNITRALYFFYHGGKIVVTHGFLKKTRKTPRGEIKLAKKRRTEYIRRMEG